MHESSGLHNEFNLNKKRPLKYYNSTMLCVVNEKEMHHLSPASAHPFL